ncbi:F-box protein At1g15015 [Lactuca sativa]|uniref:F-box protein At1g15015 n=1 Tax=Lactuca sativa TaxID=4236 RepID=UPI000CD8B8B0|nr:F-box protein At1g15015 [Lactuca sativa]
MSEYQLPFHIQEEIMKRLPVKSLIQFRCVSKEWKSLIDSSEFIAAHSNLRHTQKQHLLVSYEEPMDEVNYVCCIDDDTFPQQRSLPTLPRSVQQLIIPRVIGSSHGLFCLYGYDPNNKTKLFVLWNPWIRKPIVVAAPNLPFVGFGVCPVTNDPKIVSVTQSSWDESDGETKVMVYTLSSGTWRSLTSNLPTQPLHDWFTVVVTDLFVYWCVELPNQNMIMSF